MRASRLVNLLLLLQTRGQMTARELSRELEVSERTICPEIAYQAANSSLADRPHAVRLPVGLAR